METSSLHERVRAVVGERTYRSIGELTGQHAETVRRYVTGQPPSVEFLASLCRALGVNGDWLLTGAGPMRSRDVSAQAIREAGSAELLSGIAETLESIRDRVDRIETYVHTMETRLRAGGARLGLDDVVRGREAEHAGQTGGDGQKGEWGEFVADAIPERPSRHAD